MMLTLHIAGLTPPALAVAIALAEKGLSYDLVDRPPGAIEAGLRSLADRRETANPLESEFPILWDGEAVLNDSHFILEYLDDRTPHPPLKPSDPYGQWQVQAFARFLGERAAPAVATLGLARRPDPAMTAAADGLAQSNLLTVERQAAWAAVGSGDQALLAESRRKVGLLLTRIGDMLVVRDGGWLLGDRYTLADISAYALIRPFVDGLLPVDGLDIAPPVRAWAERVAARPAVAAATGQAPMAFLPGPEHARWG